MKPIPYARRTTYDARVSTVTYHLGKRDFGTGYDMMETIIDLEKRHKRALEKIDALEDIIENLSKRAMERPDDLLQQ